MNVINNCFFLQLVYKIYVFGLCNTQNLIYVYYVHVTTIISMTKTYTLKVMRDLHLNFLHSQFNITLAFLLVLFQLSTLQQVTYFMDK